MSRAVLIREPAIGGCIGGTRVAEHGHVIGGREGEWWTRPPGNPASILELGVLGGYNQV